MLLQLRHLNMCSFQALNMELEVGAGDADHLFSGKTVQLRVHPCAQVCDGVGGALSQTTELVQVRDESQTADLVQASERLGVQASD